MKNIELKVSIDNFDKIIEKLIILGAEHKGLLRQRDTYFRVARGRLKLREINHTEFELIYYKRPNVNKSKISIYEIMKIDDESANKMKSIFTKALGIKIIVEKERNLWIYKNTRIHLDMVHGLGCFLELETIIDKISHLDAQQEHLHVIESLNLSRYGRQGVSYSDMLIKSLADKQDLTI